nr:hypothetical protein [Streptomyces sp. SolWspMP-5a-2]
MIASVPDVARPAPPAADLPHGDQQPERRAGHVGRARQGDRAELLVQPAPGERHRGNAGPATARHGGRPGSVLGHGARPNTVVRPSARCLELRVRIE